MVHSVEKQSDVTQASVDPYILSDALTVQSIENKYSALRENVEALDPISIDVAKVTHIDTSGYQLLISLAKYCELHKKSLIINNPSDEFCDILTLLGDQILKGYFGKTD